MFTNQLNLFPRKLLLGAGWSGHNCTTLNVCVNQCDSELRHPLPVAVGVFHSRLGNEGPNTGNLLAWNATRSVCGLAFLRYGSMLGMCVEVWY